MFDFNFKVILPPCLRKPEKYDKQLNYVIKSWSLPFKYKYAEFQISKDPNSYTLLDIQLKLTFSGEDHAGLSIQFEMLGYFICFEIYDSRHWDYETNNWEIY